MTEEQVVSKEKCRETVRFILGRNIVWDDALDLKTKTEEIFIESLVRPMEANDE